ncbi:MAG: hypothetical protein HZC41_19405 [Chloroflexi bacterium]|nr:hypothetical protein [Chloroflexota bacterium]
MSTVALPPAYSQDASDFLDELARDTWTYLSSDWATDNHLPWSWRSASIGGGDYANPAEIGLYMLAYAGAYEMRRDWSPSLDAVVTEIAAMLNQLRAWQTGSQTSQPHGPNAYNNSVFYQWYWISWNPPVVGAPSGTNHVVPSIDNAWLAASLITLREWAEANGQSAIAQTAQAILDDMDFRLWYNQTEHRFYWGGVENPQGGTLADYYSNENRIINFVARALGQLSEAEYQASLAALVQSSAAYDTITVGKVAWDGSLFTYLAPALFIRELETAYGAATIEPAIAAQIAYAKNRTYTAWGLSDCFDIGTGGYIQQGSPPTAMSGSPETHAGVVTPHASGLALMTPFTDAAVINLQTLAADLPAVYDDNYGFKDSVMALPGAAYGQASARFSALAQEWLFLALVNAQTGFLWDYFYRDANVVAAHNLMFNETVYPPPRQQSPGNGAALATLNPAFRWLAVPGAVRYEFQLDTLSPPASAVFSLPTAGYTPANPLLPLAYYWRVRAVDSAGHRTFWSLIWQVRVQSPLTAAPTRNYWLNHPIILTWNPVLDATEYTLQVASTLRFAPVVHEAVVPASTHAVTIPSLSDGFYYWRVRAKTNGIWRSWSLLDSFVADMP